MPFKYNDDSDNDDSDHHERDPGREVIEKNTRNRLQRIADHTKDELNKVLKRVDTTLTNYDYSVQSSLVQHGMKRNDKSNIQHVADINELESLLNDSVAKQKYKQRLTVFIVGQTELASEKASLLQQIEQFFNEQKQSFSGNEFNTYDMRNETQDDVDLTLRSFDVKACYVHVKQLGTRLNELNEDIIQYLIQNAAAKHQLKGKKKFAQATKETKDQLSALQQRLETINNEMVNKDNKIETLEKANDTMQRDLKSKQEYLKQLQQEIIQYTLEIKSRNKHITELEVTIKQCQSQINDLNNTIATMQQTKTEEIVDTKETIVNVPEEKETEPDNKEEVPSKILCDKETQTPLPRPEICRYSQQISIDDNLPDLNELFNVTDGIDLNNVTNENLPTTFLNLRKFAVIRVTYLLKELEMRYSTNDEELEALKQEYEEYKLESEKVQHDLIEKANNAHRLRMKAEEELNHLGLFMTEQEKLKSGLMDRRRQSDLDDALHDMTSTPENSIPIVDISNEQLSSDSEIDNLDDEHTKDGRPTSSREKYLSFIEDRKTQLGPRRHEIEAAASRRTSLREGGLVKQRSSLHRINDQDNHLGIKQDEHQQTSTANSRTSSRRINRFISQMTQTDDYKLPFFHLYETIYKFRHSIINLLEQNKFLTLADRLLMVKQLSSDDHYTTDDFIDNSQRALKDICKVLQSCITLLVSSINEYELKEKEIQKESSEPTREPSMVDDQQGLILEQKESMITDLRAKCEHLTNVLNQLNAKHEGELSQNERLIGEQQKLIQNLQQQVIRLQKRLTKIEADGIVEPSIMFTRLDAERNDQALQQAVHRGKVLETTYNELNEAMEEYVRLPSQQFSNLVKRYIHFRKANELEDRIHSEVFDNETRTTLEKMEFFNERRSGEISKQILDVRQQRSHLAQILTEKFDNLEDENSLFLIRPVYSYQGRAAAQSYMKQEKRRREALLKEHGTRKNHLPSRQPHLPNNQHGESQHLSTPMSSCRISEDGERFFNIEHSVISPRSSSTRQQNDSNDANHPQQFTVQLSELTRLQEYDIQRTLMPISHISVPLLSAFASNSIDPCVPSLNLRSYLALSRPGTNNVRTGKTNEVIHNVSREGPSSVPGKSQGDMHTPSNSVTGDARRTSPTLPPIKRPLPSGVPTTTNEKQYTGFVNTTELSSAT